MVLLLVALLCVAPLPYIGTEPTEGVEPELRVQVWQHWLLKNETVSQLAVNMTVQWREPTHAAWQKLIEGNYTFYYGTRILWIPDYRSLSTAIPHTVNITVDITKRDAGFNVIWWEISAVDEQRGILFRRHGSLSSANATVHVTEWLVFETPEHWVCGGTGTWLDWLIVVGGLCLLVGGGWTGICLVAEAILRLVERHHRS